MSTKTRKSSPAVRRQTPEEMLEMIRLIDAEARLIAHGEKRGVRYVWYDPAKVKSQSWLRFHDRVIIPQKIKQPVGRPKGRGKLTKSGRRSLPTDLAFQVYQAKLDGMTWQQVVCQVLRETIPTNQKARERQRAYVNRLYDFGARLTLKKA